MITSSRHLVCLSILLVSLPSWSLDLRDLGAKDLRRSRSLRGVEEYCAIPHRLVGATYTKKDLEKEAHLCEYDFYSTVALCPKYNSTNPGVLITELKKTELTKQQIESSRCDLKEMGLKTAAKFKQSTSCSYTPSILAYYHISRALGGVGQVPVAVLRTMDAETHKSLTLKANDHLKKSSSVIASTWKRLLTIHQNPAKHPEIFETSRTQVYGALADNVRGEFNYSEVSGVGKYDTRYERFLKQRPFLNLTDGRSVSSMVGTSRFENVAQMVVQMKDVSDMVILDTLLAQQDRIGNIHYKYVWSVVDGDNGGVSIKKSDAEVVKGRLQIPEKEKLAMTGRTAALVKQMILKDNDCGVIKTNYMREFGALERIRHVSYKTYRKLAELSRNFQSSQTREFFQKELLFSPRDYENTAFLARKILSSLKQKCQAGQLHFDLDLEDYIPGAARTPKSCDT